MWKTGETSASSVRLGRLMQTSLPAIAQAARRDKTKRFRGLYSMLNRNNFLVAFRAIRKGAATGVDGVTYREYEKNLSNNLADLEKRLKEKRYRAKLVVQLSLLHILTDYGSEYCEEPGAGILHAGIYGGTTG